MTALARPIIITGFMGAGKTTVAAALSKELGCAMTDLDSFITEREGRTPQILIDDEGEASFRKLESAALRDVLGIGEARVIALGGGTWTISDNRSLINEHNALTVWLNAPFELCWQRIARCNNDRPLARNLLDAQRLYDHRLELYKLASLHVQVSGERSLDQIINEIATACH